MCRFQVCQPDDLQRDVAPTWVAAGTAGEGEEIRYARNEQPGWRCSLGHWIAEPDEEPTIGSKRLYNDHRGAELYPDGGSVIEARKLETGWQSLNDLIGMDLEQAQRAVDAQMGVAHDPAAWFPITRSDNEG